MLVLTDSNVNDACREVARRAARDAALAALLTSHNPGNALVWRWRYKQEDASNGK
jgi:hypothetical protein